MNPSEPDRSSIPAIALATVTVGTVGALSLIPTQFSQPGALFSSALAMTIGVMTPVAISAIRHPFNLFRSENLLMCGLVYWILLDLLQGQKEPESVSVEAVRGGFIGIGLFAVGIWLSFLGRPWPLPRVVRSAAAASLPPETIFGATIACFLLGMTHYVVSCDFDLVLMVESLGRNRFAAPWTASRLGGWKAFREHLVYFGYLVPTLTVLVGHLRGWASAQAIVSLVCSAIIVLFASQGGARGEVGVIVGGAILTAILLQRAVNLRTTIWLLGVTAALLIWMQVMLLIRNQGMATLFSSDRVTQQLNESKIEVDDNFNRLCQVVDLIPAKIDHTYGGQLYYVAVRPIPRAIWPNKPVNAGFSFEQAIGGDEVTTWSVTIVGELYYDFGFPFVLLGGLVYGRLAGMWNRLLDVRSGVVWTMLYGLGAMALFAGIRSEQAFVIRTYPILFWLVLSSLIGARSGSPGPVALAPSGGQTPPR